MLLYIIYMLYIIIYVYNLYTILGRGIQIYYYLHPQWSLVYLGSYGQPQKTSTR